MKRLYLVLISVIVVNGRTVFHRNTLYLIFLANSDYPHLIRSSEYRN